MAEVPELRELEEELEAGTLRRRLVLQAIHAEIKSALHIDTGTMQGAEVFPTWNSIPFTSAWVCATAGHTQRIRELRLFVGFEFQKQRKTGGN